MFLCLVVRVVRRLRVVYWLGLFEDSVFVDRWDCVRGCLASIDETIS